MIDRIDLYVTDDGRYLTGWQLRRRVRSGGWTRHLIDRSTGTIVVEASHGTIIALTRLSPGALPDWLEFRADGDRCWVADRRRTVPPSRTHGRPIEPPRARPAEAFAPTKPP